jgi:lysophospholipase L1-like esterase
MRGGSLSRLVPAILVGALLGYVLGAITVYGKIFPYEELKQLSYWTTGRPIPAEDKYATNLLFATFSPQVDVVMIGDSLTANAYWNEIFDGVKIANRGVGGNTTQDILHRMDTILSLHPTKAFVEAGINDLLEGIGVDETYRNYVAIVEALRKSKIAVVVQSTVECAKSSCGPRTLRDIRALNKKLRAYAGAHGVAFVNINDGITSEADGLLLGYTVDGIHLNGKGYVAWRKAIGPLVDARAME